MQWAVLCGFYPKTRKHSFNTFQAPTPLAATSDQMGNFLTLNYSQTSEK